MSFIFRLVKKCINYYCFGKVADQLIEKINSEQNQIPTDVKNTLITSIIAKRPDQFMEQVAQLPEQSKEELLACLSNMIAEQNGEAYRGFFIKSDKDKDVIDQFYDTPILDNNHVQVIDSKNKHTYEDLCMVMFDLYAQTEMWKAFNHQDYRPEVVEWAKNIKKTFTKMLDHLFATHQTMELDKQVQSKYTQNVILVMVTLYDKMFTSKHMGFASILKTILLECIDLANEGNVYGALTLAHYRPDLVTDEIHPVIDRDSQVYKETDYSRILNNYIFGTLYQKYQRFL